jgi:threonine aldolase
MCRPIVGRRGILDVEDFQGKKQPENVHFCRSRLVCLENTHNRGGGSIYPLENVQRICAWAHEQGLVTHLDGARLMNAVVATGVPAARWAAHFDTVSVCFSKGLGAPVGSALAGPRDLIAEARRVRRLFGGEMNQSGVLAAPCLYALEHNIDRLAEDHANAQIIAPALEETDAFEVRAADVQTNIIWAPLRAALGPAAEIAARLREHGIVVGVHGTQMLRVCTHLNVSRSDAEYVAKVLRQVASRRPRP